MEQKVTVKESFVNLDYSKIVDLMINASDMIAKDAANSYMYHSIELIYRWYLECHQNEVPVTGYLETKRVVRLKRGIPKYVLNFLKVNPDDDTAQEFSRTFLSGLYMVVNVLHLSKEFAEKCSKQSGKGKVYSLPEELKEKYQETTWRFNSDGSAIVLAKSYLTDWICAGSHYQMLEVSHLV